MQGVNPNRTGDVGNRQARLDEASAEDYKKLFQDGLGDVVRDFPNRGDILVDTRSSQSDLSSYAGVSPEVIDDIGDAADMGRVGDSYEGLTPDLAKALRELGESNAINKSDIDLSGEVISATEGDVDMDLVGDSYEGLTPDLARALRELGESNAFEKSYADVSPEVLDDIQDAADIGRVGDSYDGLPLDVAKIIRELGESNAINKSDVEVSPERTDDDMSSSSADGDAGAAESSQQAEAIRSFLSMIGIELTAQQSAALDNYLGGQSNDDMMADDADMMDDGSDMMADDADMMDDGSDMMADDAGMMDDGSDMMADNEAAAPEAASSPATSMPPSQMIEAIVNFLAMIGIDLTAEQAAALENFVSGNLGNAEPEGTNDLEAPGQANQGAMPEEAANQAAANEETAPPATPEAAPAEPEAAPAAPEAAPESPMPPSQMIEAIVSFLQMIGIELTPAQAEALANFVSIFNQGGSDDAAGEAA